MMNKNNCIILIFVCMPLYCAEKKPSANAQKIQQYNEQLFTLLQAAEQTKKDDTAKALSPSDAIQGLQNITKIVTQLNKLYKTKTISELNKSITNEQTKQTQSTEKLKKSKIEFNTKNAPTVQTFNDTTTNYWKQIIKNMKNMLERLKNTKAKKQAEQLAPQTGWWTKEIDVKKLMGDEQKTRNIEEKYKKLFNLFTTTIQEENEEKRKKATEAEKKQLEEAAKRAKDTQEKEAAQKKLLAELDKQIQTITTEISEKTKEKEQYQKDITKLLSQAKLPASKGLTKLKAELQPISTFIDTMLDLFDIDSILKIASKIEAIPNEATIKKEIKTLKQEIAALKASAEKNSAISKQIFELQIEANALLLYQTKSPHERKQNARAFKPRKKVKTIKEHLEKNPKTPKEIQKTIINLEKKAAKGPKMFEVIKEPPGEPIDISELLKEITK